MFPDFSPTLADSMAEALELARLLRSHAPLGGPAGPPPTLGRDRFSALIDWAETKNLLPLLHVSLGPEARGILLAPGDRERLWKSYATNAARNAHFQEELRNLSERFQQAGIPLLLIKGAAQLADPTHPFVAARHMADLDILVPTESLADAYRVVRERGYGLLETPLRGPYGLGPLTRPGAISRVDIHDRLTYPSLVDEAETRGVWQRAARADFDVASAMVPSPTDRLFIRLLHDTVHGHLFLDFPFHHLYETACLIAERSDSIDWPYFRELVYRHRLERFASVFLFLLELWFGVEIPVEDAGTSMESVVQDLALFRAASTSTVPKWEKLGAFRVLQRLIAAQLQCREPIDWLRIGWREFVVRPAWDLRIARLFAHRRESHLPPLLSTVGPMRFARFAVTRGAAAFAEAVAGTVAAVPYWIASNARARWRKGKTQIKKGLSRERHGGK